MNTQAQLSDLRRAYVQSVLPDATWSEVWACGTRCEVLAVGHGKPLVLIHGGLDSCMQWMPILGRLAQQYRCFAVERPNNGASGVFDYTGHRGDRQEHFAHVVRDLMDGIGVERAAVVGNSLGGLAALAFAVTHSTRVERLVLVGAPAGHEDHPPPRSVRLMAHRIAGPLIVMLSRRATRSDARRVLREIVCRHPDRVSDDLLDIGVATTRHNARAWHDFLRWAVHNGRLHPTLRSQDWISTLTMPINYIVGEHDVFATPAHLKRVAESAGAGFTEIPDAGHLPWLDEPELTLAAITQALAGTNNPRIDNQKA